VFDGFNSMAAAIQDRYTEVADELAQPDINKTGGAEKKQDELASKAEQPNIKKEKKKDKKEVTESKLPSEDAHNTTDKSESKANSQIGIDEETSITEQNKDPEKPEVSVSALVSDPDSELDLNPDRTIISTSQIGLDIKLNQVAEEDIKEEKKSDVSELDISSAADLDLNPDQTIISTSQININKKSQVIAGTKDTSASANTPLKTDNLKETSEDTTAHTPPKTPPVKAKLRKKPVVKAKVETDSTDKVSDQKNAETKTDTSIKK
jgi:serine/threonine-protein kinase